MNNQIATREQLSNQLAQIQTEVNTLSKNNSLVSCLSAANAMYLLDQVLTDDVVRTYFLPLMNTRAGFLTDRNPAKAKRGQQPPTPYSIPEVRMCLKDAILKGLLPIGNQFNIIAGSVYITREGYTALLSKMGVKHRIIPSQMPDKNGCAVYSVRIEAATAQGERISYTNEVTLKRGQYDSDALLQGKAYARSVKSLWTYVSGLDSGDVVEDDCVGERVIEDGQAQEVTPSPAPQPTPQAAPSPDPQTQPQAAPQPKAQPFTGFENAQRVEPKAYQPQPQSTPQPAQSQNLFAGVPF